MRKPANRRGAKPAPRATAVRKSAVASKTPNTRMSAASVRQVRNALEAARSKRRLKEWMGSINTLNAMIVEGGERLRRRAREIVHQNTYARALLDQYVGMLVGTGMKPSWLTTNKELKKRIKEVWNLFVDEVDADGLQDFYGLQALAARAMFEAGEVFIRFRPRRPSDGLTVPFQLQLIESEMLPYSHNESRPGGGYIRCGIEFDGIGRRTAYHFLRQHPGETPLDRKSGPLTVAVPAEEVIHLYVPLRPGQVRGLPHIAPALVRLFLLDQYDDAELERKKVAALIAGFIKKQGLEDETTGQEDEAEDDGTVNLLWEPGSLNTLLPGEDIVFSQPSESGQSYEPFQYRNLTAIGSGTGIPYAAFTGDLKGANYGSQRVGMVYSRRVFEQLQYNVMVFMFCRRIHQRFLDTAVLAGHITKDESVELKRLKWIAPKWAWLDPKKDLEAEVLAVENNFKSRSDVIESLGEDADDTDDRIAADQERLDERGIASKAPAKPAAPAAPSAEESEETEEPPEEGDDQ